MKRTNLNLSLKNKDFKKFLHKNRIYNPFGFPATNGCSILFSLKILIKNGFFSKKLMFACGQSEEN